MKKVKKAQDVFNETSFMFSKKGTFNEAFPEIKNISVDVSESGEGIRREFGESRHSHYSINNLGEYINCSNPDCYNGGFHVADTIRQMIYKNETDIEGTESCQGYEGSPNGRRKYGNCYNRFSYKIHIEYNS